MNKKISLKIAILSLAILFAFGLLLFSNAAAEWGEWGHQYGPGGWWSYKGGSKWNSRYGGGFSRGISPPKTQRRWAGWKDDKWGKFIETLQEKYPDLEGIAWDEYEDWDKDDWNALREALQEVRVEECLENFIEDIIEKFDKYDNEDWQTYNTNFFAFIDVAADDETTDVELTWIGFVETYGCFDTANNNSQLIECWKDYDTWTDTQWADFRGIYSEYLAYEWTHFNEELEKRLEDYYDDLADWEDWRDWTDEEWEAYLDKYSDFRTSTSGGGSGYGSPFSGPGGNRFGFPGGYSFSGPSGYGFGGPSGYGFGFPGGFDFGGSGGYSFSGQGRYGFSCPVGYSYGGPSSYSFGGSGGYGFGFPGRYYGYGGPGSYAFNGPGGYYKYGGSWADNNWW